MTPAMTDAAAAADPRVLVPMQITGEPPDWGHVLHTLQGTTMGTTWTVQFAGPAALRPAVIEAAIKRVLDEVIVQMSGWLPTSELCRFNRGAAGHRQQLAPGFARVIDAALTVAEASGGAFDPSAGELVALWGFGPDSGRHARHDAPGFMPPSVAQCATVACDWRRLGWDAASRTLTQPGGAGLDLSAIAKGHAVDLVSQALLDCGLPNHLIDIGGELRGNGLKQGAQPWWVDIEPPASDSGLPSTRLALHGLSIATSGDYRRCFTDADGQRRSHTLDPRSRRPIADGLASVSVVHPSAMWADGWATALMVLGPDAGFALATRLGLAALLVRRRSDDAGNSGFDELLTPALREMAS